MNTTVCTFENLGSFISSEQSLSVLLDLAKDLDLEITDILGA